MKKVFLLGIFPAILGVTAFAQTISFPTPELRVDTVLPLTGYGVTFMRPTTMINKLTIKGNRVPPTFYFQIVDSTGYNRFGVTKNGMLISGTHHDPQVNVDGLFMYGRGNSLKGADSFVAGKGVINQADTAGAIGYHFTQGKNQSVAIGYRGNRIEMSADSGRFIGNWKLGSGSGGITTENDPTVPAFVKTITSASVSNWNTAYNWGDHSMQGYLKAVSWNSVTGKPSFAAVATSGSYNDLADRPSLSDAATSSKGVVQVGSGLSVSDGTVSVTTPTDNNYTKAEKTKLAGLSGYTLPAATSSVRGGVTIGYGIDVSNGQISVPAPTELSNTNSSIGAYVNSASIVSGSVADTYNYNQLKLDSNGFSLMTGTIRVSAGTPSNGYVNGLRVSNGASDAIYYPTQLYTGSTEPVIPASSFAFWIDGSDNVWLLFNLTGAGNKKVQLQ